jgi:hypothetical protein
MEDYLRNRKPIYVVMVPDKDKREIVYESTDLPKRNKVENQDKTVVVVAPLNTDLCGWGKMAKRC